MQNPGTKNASGLEPKKERERERKIRGEKELDLCSTQFCISIYNVPPPHPLPLLPTSDRGSAGGQLTSIEWVSAPQKMRGKRSFFKTGGGEGGLRPGQGHWEKGGEAMIRALALSAIYPLSPPQLVGTATDLYVRVKFVSCWKVELNRTANICWHNPERIK